MYKENEELKLLSNVGKEGEEGFLPEGTKVTFIKAVDYGLKSYVAVQYEDRVLTLPELAVAPTKTDPLKALRKFNEGLLESSPELKKYHHNFFVRMYYKFVNFLKKLLTKKEDTYKMKESDFDNLKQLINEKEVE